ncbi:MAG: DMT family transporter [Desulfobacterales bacterium]
MGAVFWLILLALVAGACLPTQAGINAQLNLWTRSPVLTAAISFGVGTLALVIYAIANRTPMPVRAAMPELPWWVWIGGVLGAFFVASTVVLAPRLGAAAMVALIIAGQMTASLVLDHFGWLGYPMQPLNLWRIGGMGLVVAGVVMIRAF